MENTLQKLKKFIDYKKLSISAFEKIMGFSNGSLASQIKKNKTIGIDKLENILKKFPDLSPNWLLTGKGDMIVLEYKLTKEYTYDQIKEYIDNDAPLYLELHAQKQIGLEFMRGKDDISQIYQDINTVNCFQYIIANLDKHYFENIDKKLHNVSNYYNGKSFDFEQYRADIIMEIDRVKAFAGPLHKLAKAIDDFYLDIKPIDKKNIVSRFFTGKDDD